MPGDTHEVRDGAASRSLKPGDLICARVVPAGDIMLVLGGVEPVALHDRDTLMALLDEGPDPDELVAFLTRRFAPPSLVNTEGDPLVIRDTVLVPSNPAALSAALDQTYRRIEDADQREWMFEQPIDGLDRICATLRMTGSELHVSTNSDRRMDGVLATIRQKCLRLFPPEASACELAWSGNRDAPKACAPVHCRRPSVDLP